MCAFLVLLLIIVCSAVPVVRVTVIASAETTQGAATVADSVRSAALLFGEAAGVDVEVDSLEWRAHDGSVGDTGQMLAVVTGLRRTSNTSHGHISLYVRETSGATVSGAAGGYRLHRSSLCDAAFVSAAVVLLPFRMTAVSVSVLLHELGHLWGLPHAVSLGTWPAFAMETPSRGGYVFSESERAYLQATTQATACLRARLSPPLVTWAHSGSHTAADHTGILVGEFLFVRGGNGTAVCAMTNGDTVLSTARSYAGTCVLAVTDALVRQGVTGVRVGAADGVWSADTPLLVDTGPVVFNATRSRGGRCGPLGQTLVVGGTQLDAGIVLVVVDDSTIVWPVSKTASAAVFGLSSPYNGTVCVVCVGPPSIGVTRTLLPWRLTPYDPSGCVDCAGSRGGHSTETPDGQCVVDVDPGVCPVMDLVRD
jgi:hypothetical protein